VEPEPATAKIPCIFGLFASIKRVAQVDNRDSMGYIRRLEVEDMAFVGPSLYPNSNPIN
jgi:hypothetical protein